jgi:hypothetical protein
MVTWKGTASPVPLRAMVDVVPVEELLVRVTAPLVVTAVTGSKLIVRMAVCPAFSVSGNVTPERVKPVPLTEPALTVTGPVPDEVNVTDSETVDATLTDPKLTLVVLRLSLGTDAPRLIA